MTFRDWFRPPRHVLTIFLSVAVVSAGALGWLSWLLVEQDRALEVQRRQARLEQAADMLGRTYSVRGRVVEGERRGRTLGFPTANLDPDNEVLPGVGVYAGEVRFLDPGNPALGQRLPAVINVGTRPTFHDSKQVMAEAHLIDFDGDLYGRRVELSFRFHLRPERRFSDIEALKQQISADVADGRRRLEVP